MDGGESWRCVLVFPREKEADASDVDLDFLMFRFDGGVGVAAMTKLEPVDRAYG